MSVPLYVVRHLETGEEVELYHQTDVGAAEATGVWAFARMAGIAEPTASEVNDWNGLYEYEGRQNYTNNKPYYDDDVGGEVLPGTELRPLEQWEAETDDLIQEILSDD